MKVDQSVAAGGAGMLLVIVLTWASQTFWKVTIPAEVGMAIGGLIQLVITQVVPNSPRHQWSDAQRKATLDAEAAVEKAKAAGAAKEQP